MGWLAHMRLPCMLKGELRCWFESHQQDHYHYKAAHEVRRSSKNTSVRVLKESKIDAGGRSVGKYSRVLHFSFPFDRSVFYNFYRFLNFDWTRILMHE